MAEEGEAADAAKIHVPNQTFVDVFMNINGVHVNVFDAVWR
jgi:hypothetical protein